MSITMILSQRNLQRRNKALPHQEGTCSFGLCKDAFRHFYGVCLVHNFTCEYDSKQTLDGGEGKTWIPLIHRTGVHHHHLFSPCSILSTLAFISMGQIQYQTQPMDRCGTVPDKKKGIFLVFAPSQNFSHTFFSFFFNSMQLNIYYCKCKKICKQILIRDI